MAYAVSKYQDTYSERQKPQERPGGKLANWDLHRFAWFETEQAAKDFIIRRARINLENAEADVRRTRKKLAKVVKKFGTPCKHGIADPQECGLCDDEGGT